MHWFLSVTSSGTLSARRPLFGAVYVIHTFGCSVITKDHLIAFAAGAILATGVTWFILHQQAVTDAALRDVEHEKQKAQSAVIQSQRDSAANASRQWEQLYLQEAASDKPKTIYLRADAKWSSNSSADSVRAYLRYRPDSILDRWYPGKGSDHPGSTQ